MIRRLAAAWAGVLVACTAAAAAPPSASPANAEVTARLARVFGCAEQLWPGWPIGTLNVLLIDVPGEDARLLSGSSASVSPVPYGTIASQLKQRGGPGYAFLQQPAVGKVLAVFHSAVTDADLDRVVEMAVHEGFHYTGQGRFGSLSSPRGAYYPEDASARYVRHEIMRALRRAAEGEDLGAAAHWAGEFKARHAARDPRLIDRLEGTAEYVGTLGLSIAKHGCDAPVRTLIGSALGYAGRKLEARFTKLVRPDADSEAIVIGVYAGLLLRQSGAARWQEAVEQGATILEVLLQGVAPSPQPRDRELFARIDAVIAAQNDAYRPRIEALMRALQSSSHVVVSVPAVRMGSSWIPPPPRGGQVTYETAHGLVQVSLAEHASALLGAQGGSLTLQGVDTRGASRTPCGAGQKLFPVQREAVTLVGGDRADMNGDGVVGRNIRVTTHDHDGMRWLCIRPG